MTRRKTAATPAAPKRIGRPPRPRWPDLPKRYSNPSKLTGVDLWAYETVRDRGRVTGLATGSKNAGGADIPLRHTQRPVKEDRRDG